ncbi:N-acetylneuraminate synthase family protein [Synechocystis sp. PCC 7339]|uniref:N-acetylneuraminate synthase family protein n=1 Tax=Synechocystis sp. PCC 7339 TaxID=2782213 RepID=UPI001CC06A00|nr:N-acetylneuraminate synthase family protein [Synechocystis sp. PCC 7339]UAJ72575.1 N-acetylneuraminate synthase family protein [Synechocystis sp. PCC 7339]
MIIDKNLAKYIVFAEDDIITALKKISDNKSRIIFSVTEAGVLEGVLTDGDFRRWLVNQDNINLNQPVSTISNKHYKYANYTEDTGKIESYFSQEVEFIPLLDAQRHLVAIACRRAQELKIGDFVIDHHSPTFIIAEIGNNHNGSLDLAKRLIDQAKVAGADCAKFQMRDLKSLYHNAGNANDASEDLGSQYTLDLLSRFQLSPTELFEAFDYCKTQGLLPLCTPWDLESLTLLENYGVAGYKVASADLTNHDLLTAIAKTGKPMLCSTGMATEQEIIESVRLLKNLGAMFALLHCNSTYPAPFKDVNLNYLERLREIGDHPVGYSGHERGIHVAVAAVAKGAKIIEKHFTLDKTMEGNDHKVSLLPEEFRQMVEGIRQVEQSLGDRGTRKITQGELMNRETLAKSLVINCNLKKGQTITESMVEVKSPGKGLQPNRKQELTGKTAKRDFKTGDFFYASDLEQEAVQPRHYHFNRPWGLPVRYHDFKTLLAKTNPDLLEFHLSYKDLEQDIGQFFDQVYGLNLVVHAPELFAGDHLLDLCARDAVYRRRSIAEMQRVIDLTRQLKPYFRRTTCPGIVTNVGGFTQDASLSDHERPRLCNLLIDSLAQLDAEGVEIWPQTMPPFPWHFGGQRYHNLFVDPLAIADFCRQNNYRICLDISHSKLAANQYHWSFKQFIQEVGPYVAHLHIADSQGSDGEGLQIGEGEIDFPAFAEDINQVAPTASFIPEIWQGHKNEGEGFWIALERLEDYL